MFGGCLQEPKASATPRQEGKVSNDMWTYDIAAQVCSRTFAKGMHMRRRMCAYLLNHARLGECVQGWEEVQFQATRLGCDLPAAAQQLILPAPRAGHAMVSMRTGAITCGGYGYQADGRTKTYLADAAGGIDCWWFSPGGLPRWDVLKLASNSSRPAPRFGHSMSLNAVEQSVIIFGGQTLTGTLLNDCWKLSYANATSAPVELSQMEYMSEFMWQTCDPAAQLALKPQARYGHQSVYFHKALYVVGGFAQNGLRVAAMQDIWILSMGTERTWAQIMPTTKTPDARGFHAMWLSGFRIMLHGTRTQTSLDVVTYST